LEYLIDGEIVEISEAEAMKIAEYFEIIILLYSQLDRYLIMRIMSKKRI
jgi:hypothetical protein